MNIFIFDLDPEKNVQSYPDKYTIKMILESTQLLSTAVYCNYPDGVSPTYFKNATQLYLPTHRNHPSCKWARETISNFYYLYSLTEYMIEEYRHRYGKTHKCSEVLWRVKQYDHLIPTGPLTPFALAMPEQYKCSDPVKAYRDYFNGEKQHIMKWTNREVPEWVKRN